MADKNPNEGMTGPCETIIGWDHESGYDHMPTGIRCHGPGRWRAYGVMPFGSILCDDCYVSLLLRDAARRNEAALQRLRDNHEELEREGL